MRQPASVAELTELGRVPLSKHFFMREMLYSEVGNFHGIPNIPEAPDVAIEVGRKLCDLLLEPMWETFGGVVVRSAYRSPTLNEFCHRKLLEGEGAYYCGSNEYSAGRHIWDVRDADGFLGGTVSVVVPWYLDRYESSGDPEPLGWWIRDHLPEYAEVAFFPWQCAFNIRWYEGESDQAIRIDDGNRNTRVLTQRGMDNFDGDHGASYRDFPTI